ncbi:MAG: AAA family ATPase [Desulfocapsaceae bacterium]|jgi:predicted ABC-type ATPase|nr:AAA family ATPase [Desulfocapsaceae bacterium]
MSEKKQLWVLAGGNGVGKSTFYHQYLSKYGIKFVNADLIARSMDTYNPERLSYEAATLASEIRDNMIAQGESFCYETVFSHESKIDFIAMAKALRYSVILVYIHLTDPSLNEARVYQRTLEGGHGVAGEKIRSRIPRTMKNIKIALPLVDEAWILDNSSGQNSFQQIAIIKNGNCEKKVNPFPGWVMELLP